MLSGKLSSMRTFLFPLQFYCRVTHFHARIRYSQWSHLPSRPTSTDKGWLASLSSGAVEYPGSEGEVCQEFKERLFLSGICDTMPSMRKFGWEKKSLLVIKFWGTGFQKYLTAVAKAAV